MKKWGNVRDKKGKVYLAFYGSGKTYLAKTEPNYVDIEFYWYDGHHDLLLRIIRSYTEIFGYNVLTQFTPQSAKLLLDNNVDFIGVLPHKEMQSEFIKRYSNRGDSAKTINMLSREYLPLLRKLNEIECKKIYLNENEYLKDVINRLPVY